MALVSQSFRLQLVEGARDLALVDFGTQPNVLDIEELGRSPLFLVNTTVNSVELVVYRQSNGGSRGGSAGARAPPSPQIF